ncbi:MAG: hypothetical protein ACXV4C_08285 [Halobacteriota archaeon]
MNEAEGRSDDNAGLWIFKKCCSARELEPYGTPETAAEQELNGRLFGDKLYFRPLSEDLEPLIADLTARPEKLKQQKQEPKT